MASLADKRWMNIGDSSADISYTGSWFVDTYDRPGPFRALGSLSEDSAHGTASEAGFSFSFEGTDFDVRGQSTANFASTNSRIRCTIDGAEAQTDAGLVNETNFRHFRLCLGRKLSARRHTVSVQIFPGPNAVVWLDTVNFYSLAYPNIRRKQSQLTPDKSDVRFTGTGWRNPFDRGGSLGRQTFSYGDRVTLPFFGTSVQFCSFSTPSMPLAAGSATYSLDGSPPVKIDLPIWTSGFRGAGANDTIWYCPMTTPPLPPGYHTLELLNLGSASTVPLAVDYFLVSHGEIDNPVKPPQRPGQVITTGAPNAAGTMAASSSLKKVKIGPIVGAVVGPIVALGCIGLFVYFWFSRRRKSRTAQPLTQSWTLGETEPILSPSTFHGAPTITFPQPFVPPSQRVSHGASRDSTTLLGRLRPQPSVQQPPSRVSRDSMSSLYTDSPPSQPPQVRPGSSGGDSDHPSRTTSAAYAY